MRLLSKQNGSAFLGFLLLSPIAHSNSVVVPVPCGSKYFRSCDAVLSGGGSISGKLAAGSRTANSVRGILDLLSNPDPSFGRIAKHVSCLYQGHDPDPLSAKDCDGPAFGPKVCDPVASPFNNNVGEISSNHSQAACGTPAVVTVKVSPATPRTLGLMTASPTFAPTQIQIKGATSQEYSFINGALVQANACFMSQVTQELSQFHQLTVDDKSPCTGIASDIITQNSQYVSSFSDLQKSLNGQTNVGDITNCEDDWSSNDGTALNRGQLRQSAQYLCAARLAIETAFSHLAACEIFSRAQSAWVNHMGTQQGSQAFLNNLNNGPQSLNGACSSYCQNKLQGKFNSSSSDGAIETEATSCAQSCYSHGVPAANIKGMPAQIQNFIQKLWPTTPTSGMGCQASLRTQFLGRAIV